MKRKTQKEQMEDLWKRPIPRKWVGIIHLNMIKDGRCLYGFQRLKNAGLAAEMVKPMIQRADREMMLVLSLNKKLEPMAVEIAAVGGVSDCYVDVRSIFKHAVLNNAAYVICFHNHLSGYPEPSRDDRLLTRRLTEAGQVLGIPLLDHLVIGEESYYSFRENGELDEGLPDEAA